MSLERIIVLIILIVICLVTFGWIMLFYKEIKKYLRQHIYKIKSFLRKGKNKISILFQITKDLNKPHPSYSVELVFSMFSYFYEHHFKNSDSWELPETYFPNGKKELTTLYKWIKKTRKDNYNELSYLIFDTEKQVYNYWGQHYQGLNYRITTEGELVILPIDNISAEKIELLFKRKLLRIQEDLFNLDLLKSYWILEKSRFFLV